MINKNIQKVPVCQDGKRRVSRDDFNKYLPPRVAVIQDDDSFVVYYDGDLGAPNVFAHN
jgi:hypothetical protein